MRWKIAAVSGWGMGALMFATAMRLVRELREAVEPCAAEGRSREAQEVSPRIRRQDVVTRQPDVWGRHIAQEAEALVVLGFEDIATHLFAASGELLDEPHAA